MSEQQPRGGGSQGLRVELSSQGHSLPTSETDQTHSPPHLFPAGRGYFPRGTDQEPSSSLSDSQGPSGPHIPSALDIYFLPPTPYASEFLLHSLPLLIGLTVFPSICPRHSWTLPSLNMQRFVCIILINHREPSEHSRFVPFLAATHTPPWSQISWLWA